MPRIILTENMKAILEKLTSGDQEYEFSKPASYKGETSYEVRRKSDKKHIGYVDRRGFRGYKRDASGKPTLETKGTVHHKAYNQFKRSK